jgi:glycosidase
VRQRIRTSCSWPRSTGTWNGPAAAGLRLHLRQAACTTAWGGPARPVREHLHAGLDYQDKLARFLENHDEPRAAEHFTPEIHRAAAVLTYLAPGLRFFHQGQLEGFRKRISPHLVRGPDETANPEIQGFYAQLLAILRRPAVRKGQWRLLECTPAWEDNWTWDCFIAFAWQGAEEERLLVVVNYAPHASQCYLRLPFADLADGERRLQDLFSNQRYDRRGEELRSPGLYLDVPGWRYGAFSIQ